MSQLVIDVGTSSIRTCVVEADASVHHETRVPFLPSTPFAGLVEFDATILWQTVREAAELTLSQVGSVRGVGIANQRASTVVWDVVTGLPVGPALGWQDLRTIGTCIDMNARGFAMPPNASATKIAALLDLFDPQRTNRNLRFGTIDSWLVWNLTRGDRHVIDATNAALTALIEPGAAVRWNPAPRDALAIPEHLLPEIVDSLGVVGDAVALPGSPPIAALLGDQQASLLGQGCVNPGNAKATFGTGGMVDVVSGDQPPTGVARNANGTIPIAARQVNGRITWGVEAVMLSAGSCVEWLRDDLQLLATSAESAAIASECSDTEGVLFVPALLGMATPDWDYGARGTLVGLTRGTTRAHVVRAVLEGVALRGSDLVTAAEKDSGTQVRSVRVDGGMSANSVFVQAFADACNRSVEVSPVLEATALGAGLGSAVATGELGSVEDIARLWHPANVVVPSPRAASIRERWDDALERSRGWIPALSALNF